MKINVKGLSKVKVIIALFKNVYKKSEAASMLWETLAGDGDIDEDLVPVGMKGAPTEDEVNDILSTNNDFVDYIGPVAMKIKFSKDEINTDYYDSEHRTTTTPGVVTAEECIKQLRRPWATRLFSTDESLQPKRAKAKQALTEEEQRHVTFLGDSTIDNRLWTDGLRKSYVYTRLGITRGSAQDRVKQSHRIVGKPALSVIENVMDLLPSSRYVVHDYTNDGFTTGNILRGGFRDQVFGEGQGNFSLFPHQFFSPLEEGAKSIEKSQYVVLSIGGNNFRQFLQNAGSRTGENRKQYIKDHFEAVLNEMRAEYIEIVQRVRKLNKNARIILMTQYYPSASQNNYKIYPFMREIGEICQLGGPDHDPMTVIYDIMKMTYSGILKAIPRYKITVADVTSSLNPYDNQNHISQIEPSGRGGKRIAQMLQYLIERRKLSHLVYRFYPGFFTAKTTESKTKQVSVSRFDRWVLAHPYDLREGYSPDEEILFSKYKPAQLKPRALLTALNEIKIDVSKSALLQARAAVAKEAEKIERAAGPQRSRGDLKKWQMSLVLAIHVLENQTDLKASQLLEQYASRCADGKAGPWRQLLGALTMLVGAVIAGLSLAGIPVTGGSSMIGLTVAGGVLSAGGAALFYHNRQKSFSKGLSTLATAANKVPRSFF